MPAHESDYMARYRTIRFQMFEVWEDGKGELPLFVTSDGSTVRDHQAEYPSDTVTVRWWVREGDHADEASA